MDFSVKAPSSPVTLVEIKLASTQTIFGSKLRQELEATARVHSQEQRKRMATRLHAFQAIAP